MPLRGIATASCDVFALAFACLKFRRGFSNMRAQ